MSCYNSLLKEIQSGIAEQAQAELPPELELQALWFAGRFGREFTDVSGKPVKIIQFGEWNRSAGPDFHHTVVEIDGTQELGAIELDPTPQDWEAHGHGSAESFCSVVLHVTFSDSDPSFFTRDLHHRQIPRVEISSAQLATALQQPLHSRAIARPGRCVVPLSKLTHDSLNSLFKQAAQHRAAEKAGRFLRTADAHGRDAALFQATAETLGYRSNSLPMRLLSQRMPLRELLKAENDPEALLFGSAGFLSTELYEKSPPDTRSHVSQLWETWWKSRAQWESVHPIPWVFHGHRPANHPHRRVAALATLVNHWAKFRKLALARPFSPAAVSKFLSSLENPFWSFQHTLSSHSSAKPIALFGKSRSVELLVNHLIPLALQEDPEFSFADYSALPAASLNESVKRCAIRLFGSLETAKPWLKKAAHMQALLQIYHDFCLQDTSDCANCPFPEQLSQWQ